MIETLVARVFATRNTAHIAHWKTKFHAQHEALGTFYEGLIPKIDALVECYQGCKGLVGPIPAATAVHADMLVSHLTAEAEWIAAHREKLSGGVPAVANLVDDLQGLYLTTVYKLRYLA